MLADRRLVFKNVRGRRLQAGVIFGSNPKSATKWCDQPTAPPQLIHNETIKRVNTLQGEGEKNGISKQFEKLEAYGGKEAS